MARQAEDGFTLDLLPCDSPAVTDLVRVTPARSHCDSAGVTRPGSVTRPMSLVLSLFPGIDLLGKGFEQQGFCVVRGPDLITGGDIRHFHSVPGRFDGVIGGSPCPDFSLARRDAPTGDGLAMLEEYKRVVLEAKPQWWLLENVAGVPDVQIPGYSHQRVDINARECGLPQFRLRHFQFGHRDGMVLTVPRLPKIADVEPCCVASEGNQLGRRDWGRFCELQGLPRDFDLPSFTLGAKYRAVGNGVPVNMAFMVAQGVANLAVAGSIRVCACGCGRPLVGGQELATAACRKRVQRRRDRARTG